MGLALVEIFSRGFYYDFGINPKDFSGLPDKCGNQIHHLKHPLHGLKEL